MLLYLVSLVAVYLAGCTPSAPPASNTNSPATQAKPTVTISVAASTRELVEDLAAEFEKSHSLAVQINPGPSSGLARQIIAGAPADLFLSASRQWADAVAKEKAVVGAAPLLTNDLALIVPKHNPGEINTPQDLLSDKVKYVALAGESVPAGTYADQALTKLNLLATLQERGRIVRGQDVRSTLSYVERGEAEAGIVYATDVAVATNVKQVYAFPSDLHDEIVYVLVLLKSADDNAKAQDFFDFLLSAEANPICLRHGFQRWRAR